MEADDQGGDFNRWKLRQVEKPHSAEIGKLQQNVIRDSTYATSPPIPFSQVQPNPKISLELIYIKCY